MGVGESYALSDQLSQPVSLLTSLPHKEMGKVPTSCRWPGRSSGSHNMPWTEVKARFGLVFFFLFLPSFFPPSLSFNWGLNPGLGLERQELYHWATTRAQF